MLKQKTSLTSEERRARTDFWHLVSMCYFWLHDLLPPPQLLPQQKSEAPR